MYVLLYFLWKYNIKSPGDLNFEELDISIIV